MGLGGIGAITNYPAVKKAKTEKNKWNGCVATDEFKSRYLENKIQRCGIHNPVWHSNNSLPERGIYKSDDGGSAAAPAVANVFLDIGSISHDIGSVFLDIGSVFLDIGNAKHDIWLGDIVCEKIPLLLKSRIS